MSERAESPVLDLSTCEMAVAATESRRDCAAFGVELFAHCSICRLQAKQLNNRVAWAPCVIAIGANRVSTHFDELPVGAVYAILLQERLSRLSKVRLTSAKAWMRIWSHYLNIAEVMEYMPQSLQDLPKYRNT
jgi:hypothetical protein